MEILEKIENEEKNKRLSKLGFKLSHVLSKL